MTKRKSKAGGARPGAGRTPIDDKKIPVTFYIRESIVSSWGDKRAFVTQFKDVFSAKSE